MGSPARRTPSSPHSRLNSISRRRVLRTLGSVPLLLGAGASLPCAAAETSSAAVRVLIAGSGLGGIAVASRLRRALPQARITLIDAKQEHNYQPGYTLVASGIWSIEKVRARNADLQPAGVDWLQESVAAFDPANNRLSTASGTTLDYDFLVVATGLELDYPRIAGMDVAAIGDNGLGSVYHSPEAAQATWRAMDAFRRTGGRAVMTLPATPLKCAGAPLKMTFLLADRLRQAGTLERSSIDFHSALAAPTVFGVPAVNDAVLSRWQALGIDTHYQSTLSAVDLAARRATFATPSGEVKVDYDFLHVVPPMRAPAAVRDSALAVSEGPLAAGGWLEVNQETLQHRRFANVFGVGDVNGTPRGKTAATVKKSAPLVAHNLVRVVEGKAPDEIFDGYTSCPLIIREGSAMLIEFDYQGRFTPSLPFVDPLQESFMAWFMKYRLLKPAYLAVLKGHV